MSAFILPIFYRKKPLIEQSLLHYECKVVHKHDVDPQTLAADILTNSYPRGDFHRVYYGEVIAVYGAEDFKQRVSGLRL